jgi:hypothetical protein
MKSEWKENASRIARVPEVPGHEPVQRQRRAQADEPRGEPREVRRVLERPAPRVQDPVLVDRAQRGEEAVERGGVARR